MPPEYLLPPRSGDEEWQLGVVVMVAVVWSLSVWNRRADDLLCFD